MMKFITKIYILTLKDNSKKLWTNKLKSRIVFNKLFFDLTLGFASKHQIHQSDDY